MLRYVLPKLWWQVMPKKCQTWFEHVPLQGVPQPEAGDGGLLIPTIRPSGLKFALNTAVFHTGSVIRCEAVLIGASCCGTLSKTNGSFY